MKRVVLTIGTIESFVIFLYGLSIVIRGTLEKSEAGSPLAQFVIYTMFAAALAASTWGISKEKSWSRTPFALMQIFIGIAGYTLFIGTATSYKVVGVFLIGLSIAGFISFVRTPHQN